MKIFCTVMWFVVNLFFLVASYFGIVYLTRLSYLPVLVIYILLTALRYKLTAFMPKVNKPEESEISEES